MPQRWPARLWVVRHGESAANVARDAAYASGAARIALDGRDADVPLSPLGERQSRALGRWFADLPPGERPEVVLASPFLRARQTAEIALAAGRLEIGPGDFRLDERLRERDFGVLDGLTGRGIRAEYPDQAALRRALGKFYHRPPGGEAWCDVILRLRGALDTMSLHHEGRRVLLVAHQVVVLCLRYLLEDMDEARVLAVDREGDVANCAVTEYAFDGPRGAPRLVRYNHVAPLERAGEAVTAEPDAEERRGGEAREGQGVAAS